MIVVYTKKDFEVVMNKYCNEVNTTKRKKIYKKLIKIIRYLSTYNPYALMRPTQMLLSAKHIIITTK